MIVRRLTAFPTNFSHSAVEAADADWRLDFCKFLGNLATLGKEFQLGEGQVAHPMMPSHEFGLVITGHVIELVNLIEWWRCVKGDWSLLFNVSLFPFVVSGNGDIAGWDCFVIGTMVAPSEADTSTFPSFG